MLLPADEIARLSDSAHPALHMTIRRTPPSASASTSTEFQANRVLKDRLQVALALCACVLIAVGIVARLRSLGAHPLAADEYYSARSVQFILEKGVPEFPSGGYYLRSLPLQYLEALSCIVLGDNEASHRLPAALFGIASLGMFFLLSRCFLPLLPALFTTAILALSSWEIEFSRFARMYTALQFTTLAFFWALYKSYRDPEFRRRWGYLPHLFAFAAVVIQPLGLFLLPFLALAALHTPSGRRYDRSLFLHNRYAWTTLAAIAATFALPFVQSRISQIGVADPLPAESVPPPEANLGRIQAFPFFELPVQSSSILIGASVIAGVLLLAFLSRSRGRRDHIAVPFGLTLLGLSAALHLFAACVLIGAVLILRYRLLSFLAERPRNWWLLAAACAPALFWIAQAIAHPETLARADSGDFGRQLRATFFGFPDLYLPVARVWLDATPVWFSVIAACTAWSLIRLRGKPWHQVVFHPSFLFPYVVVAFGILNPQYNTTRYGFFVYPLFIVTCVLCLKSVGTQLFRRKLRFQQRHAHAFAVLVVFPAFLATEDFHLRQVLHPDAEAIGLRMGRYERLQMHWYPRADERTPAQFLNQSRHLLGQTPIVLQGLTAVSYYLEQDLNTAVFLPRERPGDFRYVERARDRGRRDRWTDSPLLGDEADIRAFTDAANQCYLVRNVMLESSLAQISSLWNERFVRAEQVFISPDKRIEVIKVVLAAPGDSPIRPVGQSTKFPEW